jgi:hypothetical protein
MVDQIDVKFGADTSELDAGAARAGASIDKLTGSVGKLTPELKKHIDTVGDAAYNYGPWSGHVVDITQAIGSGMVAALGLAGAAMAGMAVVFSGALAVMTHEVVALGVETGKLAAEFGDSTENIGKVGGVAAAAGLDLKELGQSLADLKKNSLEDDDKTVAALKAIGLNADSVKGKDLPALLALFADRFSKTGDSANKTAVAVALFGKEIAEKLLPELNRGADHMAFMAGMAERTGTTLSGPVVDALYQTKLLMMDSGDNVTELGKSFGGLSDSIFMKMKPAVDGMIMWFKDLVKNMASGIEKLTQWISGSGTLSNIFTVLSYAVRGVAIAIETVVAAFQTLLVAAVFVMTQTANLYNGLRDVVVGFATDMIGVVPRAFTAIFNAGVEAAKGIGQAFSNLGSVIKLAFTGDLSGARAALGTLQTDATAALGRIGDAAGTLGEFTNTSAAFKKMGATMKTDANAAAAGIVEVYKNAAKQIETTIYGLPTAGKAPGLPAGDPSVKDKPDGRAANDAVRAAMSEVDGTIKVLQQGLALKKTILDAEVAQHLITADQKYAILLDETNKEYEAEKALLKKEEDLGGLSLRQKQDIKNKLLILEQTHVKAVLDLNIAQVAKQQKVWEGYANTVTGAFNSQLRGLLAGTTSFAKAFKNIIADLIMSFITASTNMAGVWLADEARKTFGTTSNVAARSAAEAAGQETGMLATLANALKSIFSSGAATQAGVTANLAPVLGPAALPAGIAAGAATIASAVSLIPSFDVGAWNLSSDQVAQVHKGEAIMPAGMADKFRAVMSGQGGGGAAGDTHVHVHVSAIDTRSGLDFLKGHAREFAKELNKQMSVNPSLRPAY